MRTELPDLAPLAVRGADAAAFLQNQLTCDMREITPARGGPGALCTPKGRVAAYFDVLPWPDGYLLVVDRSLVDALAAQLTRVIFRSKVKVLDLSSSLRLAGLLEPGSFDGPEGAYACAQVGDGLVVRLRGARPRFLVAEPRGAESPATGDVNAWELAEIEAGAPRVTARTSEAFLPQFLNLDQEGGLSFKKGCYTGQEVVARTQHLGEVKRRMLRARSAADAVPEPGTALRAVHEDGGERDGGTVVRAARTPAGGVDLLAVVALGEHAAGRPIHLGSAAGPRLSFA